MSFALYRGGQWVALPDRRKRSQEPLPPSLVSPAGERWRPDLELSPDPSKAWASESLALAIERAGILACTPGGWVTAVRRLP
jgi:hypothetical protein